jgi:hypothetical protein
MGQLLDFCRKRKEKKSISSIGTPGIEPRIVPTPEDDKRVQRKRVCAAYHVRIQALVYCWTEYMQFLEI